MTSTPADHATIPVDARTARAFLSVFNPSLAGEAVAATLRCDEVDALVALLLELGADHALASSWLTAHQDDESDCVGHPLLEPNAPVRLRYGCPDSGARVGEDCLACAAVADV
jgi:hypothetical protein